MTGLGSVALWLSLLLGLWGSGAAARGASGRSEALCRSACRTPAALAGVLTAAVLSLATGVLRQDFDLRLVATHATRAWPPAYALGSVFASPAGTLLVVCWAVALLAVVPIAAARARLAARLAGLVSGGVAAAAAILLVLRPFARLGYTPLEGRGLDPIPRHPLALLELGLAQAGLATLVLFGLVTIARRLARQSDHRGPPSMLLPVAWVLLSAALGLRFWRVYAVLAPEPLRVWSHLGPALVATWILAAGAFHLRARPRAGELISLGGMALTSIAGLLAPAGPIREIRLATGEPARVPVPLGVVSVSHLGVSQFEIPGGFTAAATLEVREGAGAAHLLTVERRQFVDVYGRQVGAAAFRPARLPGVLWDLRVTSVPAGPTSGTARALGDTAVYYLRVFYLGWFAWVGFAAMAAGGLLAAAWRRGPGKVSA